MKRSMFLAVVLALVAAAAWIPVSRRLYSAANHRAAPIELARGDDDDPNARDEMEFLMLRDPRTHAIPWNIRQRELAFMRAVPTRDFLNVTGQAEGGPTLAALTWTERGPNNVGGRTRAFAVDVAHPTTLLAGSVAGGIWKSTDDGASWSRRTAPAQIHGTTCIAQDRRAGKTHLWYVGTGELRGSTTNDTRWGSLYRGDGIFKSTDNGDTWMLLPSTSSGTPQVTDAFDWIINVATNPAATAGQDHVFAATHNGIQRSTDGGSTWTQVVASDSGYTDVAVTSTGVAYAFTRTAGAPRIRRSTDGVTWTSIAPASFPTLANRIVIGLAPSQPNVVYLFVQGVPGSSTPQVAGHQLWKYTYVSGNGSGAGGVWENRGGNLPGDIFAQGGYDMVCHVKSDDPNFVLIGGTNLYRSTDGFASAFTTTTIGGYPYWPDGNHHPDLHSGGFSPANPNVYYSANDGGVQQTTDVSAAVVAWASLDHGYNVTQFYSVSIAPEAGSDLIMAGAQDNGTQLGNAPGASDWTMVYGGDGTVVEVAPLADNRLYTQWQNGNLQRHQRDGTGYVELTPIGASNQLFVNPIVFDPNQSSILYYAAGTNTLPVGTSSRIWRNDAAPVGDGATGWTHLATTDVGSAADHVRRISALGISTANASDVLYYGTTDGIVMRADGANGGAPDVSNITPPGLNAGSVSGGFVRCVAVDPENSNHAVLAFGNYNFPSLWETTDGGATWTDVEGNLAGPAGPSVRWVSMFRAGGVFRVFLGTSVGVLSTTSLTGGSTVWAQEATSEIGNVLIAYMDYRESDRTLAIGTHARGVFTTQFPAMVAVQDHPGAGRISLGQSHPNPARRSATIHYELPEAQRVALRVYDVAGREIATLVDGMKERGRHEARFDASGHPGGVYYYVLRTPNGSETKKLMLVR